MRHIQRPFLLFQAALLALLIGCSSIGLPTPTTFNERLAAGYASVTQVRASATQMLTAKQIDVKDAENVLESTDAAREGLDVARSVAATDPAAANAKLTATVTVLTALQGYLATRTPK